MATFGKTRAAADYICRHTSSDLTRYRALVLLARLRSCEAALDTVTGDMPVLVKDQFLDLAHTVRDLVGTIWLTVNADDPDVAAFAALDSTPTVPSPADLDEILSRVLWACFTVIHPQRNEQNSLDP
jgi:hypothetical protein